MFKSLQFTTINNQIIVNSKSQTTDTTTNQYTAVIQQKVLELPINVKAGKVEDWLQNILYINLDERTDRRQHIEKELQDKLVGNGFVPNAVITRLSATKMAKGAVGCSMSHIRSLEMAKQQGWEYVMICEDDMEIVNTDDFHTNLRNVETRRLPWDVLVLAGNNNQPYQLIADKTVMRIHNCQTTTAYIVAAHYYDTLIQNFREGLNLLMRNPQQGYLYALDIYWKRLQIRDTWLLSLPLCVSQYANYSDVEKRDVSYSDVML